MRRIRNQGRKSGWGGGGGGGGWGGGWWGEKVDLDRGGGAYKCFRPAGGKKPTHTPKGKKTKKLPHLPVSVV